MAAADTRPGPRWAFTVAAGTDPGNPNKENQDDFFVWRSGDGRSAVVGVLDGHGREVGRLAAQTARASLEQALGCEEGLQRVREAPVETLQAAFVRAHAAVKLAFKAHFEATGWAVCDSSGEAGDGGGFLMKRRRKTQAWSCVHGGTTATVAAVVDGARLVTANVGDSDALLGGLALHPAALTQLSAPLPGCRPFAEQEAPDGKGPAPGAVPEDVAVDPLVLTADHGPESRDEFARLRAARPDPARPSHPELLMVYDSPSFLKHDCPEIHTVQPDGSARPRRAGRYYKSVRQEWASLVSTPQQARYQDALAFVRSIGDFHLQTYGVTHVPDVFELDLRAEPVAEQEAQMAALCVASDGFWDNWKYEDLSAYLMADERVRDVVNGGQPATDHIMEHFLQRNLALSHQHFGSQCDNQTAIILYLFPEPELPAPPAAEPTAAAPTGPAAGTEAAAEGEGVAAPSPPAPEAES